MSDPALVLQGAMASALKAANVCSQRIYDLVPEDPTFPYATVGTGQSVNEINSCFGATEVTAIVDIWSREPGFPEAKTQASTARTALDTQLSVSPHRIVVANHVSTDWLVDPDGLTRRARMTFRYLIDHEI